MTKTQNTKRRPSVAVILAFVALLTALSNGASAVASAEKNSVVSKSIKNGQVKTADLAPTGVTAAKLANAAVGTAKLQDGSVTSAKIANQSIQGVDLGEGSVGGSELGEIATFTDCVGRAGLWRVIQALLPHPLGTPGLLVRGRCWARARSRSSRPRRGGDLVTVCARIR